VEEIFGDIQDEHDSTKLTSRCVAPGVYEFSGRCEITEINERYNLDIPEDESYQTLAGYILESTGSIPEAGESVVIDERRFDIIKKSATRLELIRLTLPTTAAEEE
jgi:CBS domain protein